MRRLLLILACSSALFLFAIYAVFYTQSGLKLILAGMADGVSVGSVSGTLAEGLQLGNIDYRIDGYTVSIGNLSVGWNLYALLRGQFTVTSLHAEDISVTVDERLPAEARPTTTLRLPVDISIMNLVAVNINITDGRTGKTFSLARLSADAHTDAQIIYLDKIRIDDPAYRIKLSGVITLADVPEFDLNASWSYVQNDLAEFEGVSTLGGNLDRITVHTSLNAPFATEVDLTLEDITESLSWDARIHTEQLDLSDYINSAAAQKLIVDIFAQGSSTMASVTGDVKLAEETQGAVSLKNTDGAYRFDKLDLDLVADIAAMDTAHPQITAVLNWDDIRLSSTAGEAFLSSANGEAGIIFQNNAFELTSTADFHTRYDIHGRWRLAGTGENGAIHLRQLYLQSGAGTIEGTAILDLSENISANLDLTGHNINPGDFREEWPGNLSLETGIQINNKDDGISVILNSFKVSGTLRDLPVDANLAASLESGMLHIDHASLRSGSTRIELSGVSGTETQLEWNIDSPDLNAIHPQLHGRISGAGQLSGSIARPDLKGTLQADAISTPWLELEHLKTVVSIMSSAQGQVESTLTVSNLVYKGYQLDNLDFGIDGTLSHHSYRLGTQNQSMELSLAGRGSYLNKLWSGTTSGLKYRHRDFGNWDVAEVFTISLRDGTVDIDRLCVEQPPATICATAGITDATNWFFNLEADDVSMTPFNRYMPENIILDGKAGLKFSAAQSEGIPVSAEAGLHSSDGTIRFDSDTGRELGYDSADATLVLRNGLLNSDLTLKLSDDRAELLTARMQISGIETWTPDSENLDINAEINWRVDDISFLSIPGGYIDDVSGRLDVDMAVNGRLSNPLVSGEFGLQEGAFIVPDLGIQLHDISIQGSTAADSGYTLGGSAASGQGNIRFTAAVNTETDGHSSIHAEIHGDRVEIINLPEIRALATPDLKLTLSTDRITSITGAIEITDTLIDLDEMKIATTVSEDIVFAEDEGQTDTRTTAATIKPSLQVSFGNNVRIEGQGIKGDLAGNLRISSTEQGEMIGAGEILIQSGSYSAYGQSLKIEEGRLIYRQHPLDNPELRIRAARTIGEINAGVGVTGFLTNPEITLYSTPPMNQEEVLSYIVFGRPLSGLTSGEGSDLIGAATAIGLQNSGLLTKSLSSTFGVDELAVVSDSTGTNASVIVGKYLTPKLYLSYGIGLFETINTARMRYDLSRSWSLEAKSGEAVGVDLFYKIDR